MNRKQLTILLLVGLVVGAAGWYMRNQRASGFKTQVGAGGEKVIPNFPINDIAHLRIKGATGEVNIVKQEDLWRVKERFGYPANFSELGDFIDMPFKSYSQGMGARLAFSIATTLEPEILLMDEWIGAGDAEFQAKAKQRMSELADKAGIIVLASHQSDLLARTCNKVLELDHGKVKRFTSAAEYFGPLAAGATQQLGMAQAVPIAAVPDGTGLPVTSAPSSS